MNCQVCGKYSGYYPLCKECNELKESGEVIKCAKCGSWKRAKEPCPNCNDKTTTKENNYKTVKINEENAGNDLTCIICGEPSNGKHFCKKCYAKYRDKSIDIRITHCTETILLDEYGNLQYKCDDGRRVRSRAELIISNFFFKERIITVYEKSVYYKDKNGEDKVLHPDFYLPEQDIYIEYNELTNKEYLKSKEYTKKIYEEIGKKVLVITAEDLKDIEACLKPKLNLH